MPRYVYILSDYGEFGAENVKASLDPQRLRPLIKELTLAKGAEKKFDELIADPQEISVGGANLSDGWGGAQLHIVPLQ